MYLYMMLFNDGTVIPSLLNYLYVSRINHDNAKWSTHLWSEKKRVPLVRRLCKGEPRGGGRIPGGSNRQALPERRITEARLLPAGELGGRSNSLQLYSRREAARARLAELEREWRGRRRTCSCKEQTRSSQAHGNALDPRPCLVNGLFKISQNNELPYRVLNVVYL